MRWYNTHLQPEEFAYPNNTYTRRGVALCEDGRFRRVWAKVADSYFTIPARCKIKGRTVTGFLTVEAASGSQVPLDDEPVVWFFTATGTHRDIAGPRGGRDAVHVR